jgi:hypothetical protein
MRVTQPPNHRLERTGCAAGRSAVRSAHRSPLGEPQMTQAEDSVRFYALRMQETGLIKWGPQKIMAQGTN